MHSQLQEVVIPELVGFGTALCFRLKTSHQRVCPRQGFRVKPRCVRQISSNICNRPNLDYTLISLVGSRLHDVEALQSLSMMPSNQVF